MIAYFKLYGTLVGNQIDNQYTNIHYTHWFNILTYARQIKKLLWFALLTFIIHWYIHYKYLKTQNCFFVIFDLKFFIKILELNYNIKFNILTKIVSLHNSYF